MVSLGARCHNVFQHISKVYNVNRSTCLLSLLPRCEFSTYCIVSSERCLPPNKPYSVRYSHSFASTEVSQHISIHDELDGKSPLLACELQYCVRVGSGVKGDPPVVLLDGSEPSFFTAHLQVVSNEGPEVDTIEVCEYSETTLQKYRPQSDKGTVYKAGSVLNYSFRVMEESANMMCCLSLCYSDGTFLGRGYLALDQITLLDHIALPLINETDTIIGLLACSILEIKGLKQPPPSLSPATTDYSTTLEIGHRGCGVTHTDKELFSELPCLPENTIASMETAYRHGAHMVETDVVVTQDLRAVLYHDLEIELPGKRKVPICHMTSHALEWAPTEGLIVDEKQRSQQLLLRQNEELAELQQKSKPYPYLSDALRTLPSELGLMLEVKADLPYEGAENVTYHADKNVYLDVILHDLFHNVANRNLILCSFCPDTCVMLRNKQNRWPVVLIVQGSTETYADCLDNRVSCLKASVTMATAENLHGISIFSGLLKDNPASVIESVKQTGLFTFVWGYHCCDQQFRDEMRSSEIGGIIYDRIYEENLPKKNIF
ncbi:glycerophosphocholine phosphodiesterase GPCPD1-like isoform X1 [Bolinopsis microptera]|uniref:glycerophosphocholine phosphodiesterase GPCPD1-like isoform X1 n=1 Tax=Bolinopsis microptera TaxID=2820187 RepID=UPI003078EBB1